MSEPTLQSRSSFAGLPYASAPSRGVIASDRHTLAIVRATARKQSGAAFSASFREHFGIELPRGPHRAEFDGIACVGIGIDTWLITADRDGSAFSTTLKAACGAVAALSDQSGGYAVLRLSGPNVRDALAKFLPIDLHAREFKNGDAAATTASHMAVTLWALENGPDGSPVYEIAVPRSLALSFWEVLTASAAEFGFVFTA